MNEVEITSKAQLAEVAKGRDLFIGFVTRGACVDVKISRRDAGRIFESLEPETGEHMIATTYPVGVHIDVLGG